MTRRSWLRRTAAAALPLLASSCGPGGRSAGGSARRVRPGDPAWPGPADWEGLNRQVDGQLIAVRSPLAACRANPEGGDCAGLFQRLKNPYYLGDEVGLTQTLGWVDGWTSEPSAYAVAARKTADVVAAVNFARERNLRLVVKGGGHSYQGTSCAPDSLLIWTRGMNAIALHDAFVPAGCAGRVAPQPAATIDAGAMWMPTYAAVTTRGGRYVQGGGCTTVGVAGLIQSGGFGSFSKRYGLAAAALLQAEVVTADGAVRTVNACSDPDLFWALKGGGGGTFGVVTRLTVRTRELPGFFGAVFATVKASSDAAFRRLVDRVVGFYADALANPHWGEQIAFQPDNVLPIQMVFQDLDQRQAEDVWRPFLSWLAASPADFTMVSSPAIVAVPARRFWDPTVLRQFPGLIVADDRPGAPADNVLWAANVGEAGQVLHGYQSAWLPATLLQAGHRGRLADALFGASRHWRVTFHFNKGLAGAPAEEVTAARDTATNPAVLDAFALAICAASGPPAYPGIAGHEPDQIVARQRAERIDRAMRELRAVAPDPGSYVSESNFFEASWQRSYWGDNYARLLQVKDRYDPDGLFVVHNGVGSERWSADGFSRAG